MTTELILVTKSEKNIKKIRIMNIKVLPPYSVAEVFLRMQNEYSILAFNHLLRMDKCFKNSHPVIVGFQVSS
jgi:hypothetical protein